MITITKVASRSDLMRFIKLPFTLYKNDPYWVAPLIMEQKSFFNPKKNPYYEHSEVQLFLAMKGKQVVGRISAQTNTQHNKFHEDKVGFFGFFESVNDQDVADKLFDAAAQWLRDKGLDTMRGPMNFSTNHECGLLVKGFDSSPFILMTHNPEWYQQLYEQAGLIKEMDLLAYLIPRSKTPERLARVVNKLEKRGRFTVRELSSKNKKELRKDIETVFTIYSQAWEKNWGFVPATRREFDNEIDQVLSIIRPEFFYLAYVDDKPAGFYVALPDYNQILKKMKGRVFPFGFLHAIFGRNKITAMRVVTMGVVKEFQNRGIDTVFYTRNFMIANNHPTLDIKNAEMSWILENNVMMNRIASNLGGDAYKRYRIYDRKIENQE